MSQNVSAGERDGPKGGRVTGGDAAEPGGVALASRDDERPVVSAVLPTLNEEQGIRECICRIKRAVDELDVTAEVVVSDASTDRTAEIAREEGAIVVEPDRPGYGYAYRYAFERVRGDYVVIGDADTTYDFEELPVLYRHVADGDADMAIGSRLEGEIASGAMPPLHRYVGNPLLTAFLNVFYDAGVSDAHSGFRVIDREALDGLGLHADGMEFASEMIMDAVERDLTIAEEPITYQEREGEATLNSFQDGWRHVKFMLVNAPGSLFSGPAALLGLVGAVVLGTSLVGGSLGPVYFGKHTALAGSLLLIVAHQVASLAVVSGVVGEPIRDPDGPLTRWILDRFRLEHGVAIGTVGIVAGTAYAGYGVTRWLGNASARDLLIAPNMVAFTVIVLGVQTLFYSFFLSMVAQVRCAPATGDSGDDVPPAGDD